MGKTKKRKLFVFLLVVISMLTMAVLHVSANGGDVEQFIGIDNIRDVYNINDITFYHCENTSPEMALRFENSMLGVSDDIVDMATAYSYNFWCMILGHNWQMSIHTTVEHRVSATNLRCRRTDLTVDACTRNCGNSVILAYRSMLIFCC